MADRVTAVEGALGDGRAPDLLEIEHGFGPTTLGFVFLDHDKSAYLPDIRRIIELGWLAPAAVVVADNVWVPGPRVPGLHEVGGGSHLEHHRAPDARGVPVGPARPGSGIPVPGRRRPSRVSR